MSYAPKRQSISPKRRAAIFLAHGGKCWLCGEKIGANEPYDIDHQIAREISRDDSDANLAPAHKHCHRIKTAEDRRLIAKSNRIRRANGPVEQRRKTRPIKSPGFARVHRPMKGRSTFESRKKS